MAGQGELQESSSCEARPGEVTLILRSSLALTTVQCCPVLSRTVCTLKKISSQQPGAKKNVGIFSVPPPSTVPDPAEHFRVACCANQQNKNKNMIKIKGGCENLLWADFAQPSTKSVAIENLFQVHAVCSFPARSTRFSRKSLNYTQVGVSGRGSVKTSNQAMHNPRQMRVTGGADEAELFQVKCQPCCSDCCFFPVIESWSS
jgi:hypothetical protein